MGKKKFKYGDSNYWRPDWDKPKEKPEPYSFRTLEELRTKSLAEISGAIIAISQDHNIPSVLGSDYADYIATSIGNSLIYSEYISENIDTLNTKSYAEFLADRLIQTNNI